MQVLNKPRILTLLSVTLLITTFESNHSYASYISYNDRTAFLSATGAYSATSGPISGSAVLQPTYTQGTTTFTAVSNSITVGCPTGNAALDYCVPGWSPTLLGDDIALTGSEDLDVGFGLSVYGFGFEMIEPTVLNIGPSDTFINSTFTITLLSGSTSLQSFTLNPINDAVQFFGVWTDFQFDNVQIRETVGARENEFFGEFWAVEAAYIPDGQIPIGSSIYLLALGLVGLGWSLRIKA